MFCWVWLCMLSSFAIILIGKKYAATLPCLPSWCLVSAIALWLFLVVPWVGLQGVIVVFLDHTYLKYNELCFVLNSLVRVASISRFDQHIETVFIIL